MWYGDRDPSKNTVKIDIQLADILRITWICGAPPGKGGGMFLERAFGNDASPNTNLTPEQMTEHVVATLRTIRHRGGSTLEKLTQRVCYGDVTDKTLDGRPLDGIF